MVKQKITISVSEDIARYLRSTPNASSTVAEAVTQYRAREREQELEQAYREDAEEAERLNRDWEDADAEVDE